MAERIIDDNGVSLNIIDDNGARGAVDDDGNYIGLRRFSIAFAATFLPPLFPFLMMAV